MSKKGNAAEAAGSARAEGQWIYFCATVRCYGPESVQQGVCLPQVTAHKQTIVVKSWFCVAVHSSVLLMIFDFYYSLNAPRHQRVVKG